MRLYLITILLLGFPAAAEAQAGGPWWAIDSEHSVFDFTVRLVGFNRVRGSFSDYRGAVTLDQDDFTRSSITLSVDVASVQTGNEERNEHLRSEVFFDAARFPRMLFRSERIEREGYAYRVTGLLTIRDSTRQVSGLVRLIAPKAEDPFGNQRLAFGGEVRFTRREFGVEGPKFWNRAISDSVTVEFEFALRQWNYFALGWGSKRRTSIGKVLFERATEKGIEPALAEARQLYAAHRADSTWSFDLWEFQKAAGRLSQNGRSADAAKVLALCLELRPDASIRYRALISALLAEAALAEGDPARAREALYQARQWFPGEPLVVELARRMQ